MNKFFTFGNNVDSVRVYSTPWNYYGRLPLLKMSLLLVKGLIKMQLSLINSIRTNNFNDNQMGSKIGSLWKEASDKLKTYKNNTVYGVYYDYVDNYKGDYSLGVGIEENNKDPIINIPNQECYKVFKVDTTQKQGILNTWNIIWGLEDKGTLNRAYTVDFEKYYPNGEIEIHIATK